MRSSWRILVPALAVALSGCPGNPDVTDPPPDGQPSASLKELLDKPRSELASMADDWQEKVGLQEKSHREGRLPYALLQTFSLPVVVPVLREAHFAPAVGVSLPPYVAAGQKDPDLALLLARHGDVDAARLLVDPNDAETRRRIEECAGHENYPVEWTRLVGLMLHEAEAGVAMGDPEHLTDLIAWHQELTRLLDARASQGPLGAALLGRGREVLTQAAAAWQAGENVELADRARKALASWGPVPAPAPLPLGVPRDQAIRMLRPAAKPDDAARGAVAGSVNRGLDLFGLPLPSDDAEAVVGFIDASGRLAEVQVVYRTKTAEHYPTPEAFAVIWEEESLPAATSTDFPGRRRRTYRVGPQAYEVTLVDRSSDVGGFVRCRVADAPPPPTPTLPRDFRAASLDRSFEGNRLQVNTAQRGDAVFSEKAQVLGGVTNLLPALAPQRVTVQRQPGQDQTARVVLAYPEDAVPLSKVVQPLWTAWGPCRIDSIQDEAGGHLALTWDDGRTRCVVNFPFSVSEPVTFVAEDGGGRPADVQSFDKAERQARLKAGKPLSRLPRSFEWDGLKLGASKDEALQALPSPTRSVLKRDLADGWVFTFAGEPSRTATLVPRQLVVRLDGGKVAELRTRYEVGPSGKGFKDLVAGFQKKAGAPAESPAPWALLWRGLSEKKPAPALLTWQDDVTVATCQTDAWGAEVVLVDWPADRDAPPAPKALQFLPRGPEDCPLGEKRDDLLARWAVKQPEMANGALVLRPSAGGRYDVLLVYFEDDKVSRVVARHAPPAKQAPTQPVQLAAALTEAWGRDIASLGWPARQDADDAGNLTGLGWHDDRLQVRIFWQEASQGPRVYTEWKPVPAH